MYTLSKTPAKSIPLTVVISEETQAILKEISNRDYKTSDDLPRKFRLTYTSRLKDVSAFGNIVELDL